MVEHPHIWQVWGNNLHHWGIKESMATLLDAAGPLTSLMAQLVYISQPLLGGSVSSESMDALVDMLDEPEKTKAFINVLRETS